LNKMRQAFEEADSDGNGTLDLEEFKDVITNLFHFKFKVCNILNRISPRYRCNALPTEL